VCGQTFVKESGGNQRYCSSTCADIIEYWQRGADRADDRLSDDGMSDDKLLRVVGDRLGQLDVLVREVRRRGLGDRLPITDS
jgi:hypothetical protein